jgi:hypothetical protein
MAKKYLLAALLIGLLACWPLASTWGRGGMGGGGHAGGMGGMGGGMPHGGGMGGFGGGAHGPGGMGGMGGMGGGGMGGMGGAGHMPGNLGGGGFPGGDRGPGGAGGDRGPGGAGGFGAGGFGAGGFHPDGGMGGRPGGPGAGGFNPGDRGGLGGPGGLGGDNRFATPDRGDLNRFLGLPSDEGFHGPGSFGVGKGNIGVGGAAGIGGGRAGVGAGGIGRPGVGPGGVAHPGEYGGFGRIPASDRYTAASAVRHDYHHWDYYHGDWYRRYPDAWFASGWAAGAAWQACTWSNAALYCGYGAVEPMYYDYGNNITYQDNSVYVNGQSVGTGEEYYNQAATIASTGASAQASSDGDWMPLGVFALTKSDTTKSDVTIQLAVNKDGVIRGNSTDTQTDKNQVIQGSVDKQTQRVAFTVGDNTENVVETGLYNLTKDEAPCLIHFGKDKTEQWLLVRLQKPADAPQN